MPAVSITHPRGVSRSTCTRPVSSPTSTSASTSASAGASAGRPAVIAHRGASGHRPENTLAAFELAARMGADRLEPDLVPTRDGVLVLRHESELTHSTDIASRPELAARRSTREVQGRVVTGWFTEDLTLAEVRSLRAVEPHPLQRPATTAHDGRHQVPTFAELLVLAERLRAELGRPLVVSAEVKEPARCAAEGIDVAALVVAELRACGVDPARPGTPEHPAPVALQCFEPAFLRRLRADGVALPLVQLVDDDEDGRRLCTPLGLREVSTYAEVIAPCKDLVLPVGPDGALGAATSLVADAHAASLAVHVWTLRDENVHLPPALRLGAVEDAPGRALAEHLAFLDAGVDGVFTDHPGTGVQARALWLAGREGAARVATGVLPAVPAAASPAHRRAPAAVPAHT